MPASQGNRPLSLTRIIHHRVTEDTEKYKQISCLFSVSTSTPPYLSPWFYAGKDDGLDR